MSEHEEKLPPEFVELLRQALEDTSGPAPGYPLLPPWETFPDIPPGSIGWRMGPGDQYNQEFTEWLCTLTENQVALYVEEFPEPESWRGFYERKLTRCSK
tara:strand:+ start:13226 stop:13525 length:300 start_codon:yes stop_codon:yes gene_type:complete